MEYFTPSWRRPIRKNDVVPSSSSNAAAADGMAEKLDPFWWQYPCLVCGKPPPPRQTETETTGNDKNSASSHHKRCSRCHSAIYCSSECQRQDYIQGKHKINCIELGKLSEEKARLEGCLWENKTRSNNPFDDEVYDYPVVGTFWHDQPRSELQRNTTNYCVVLLQLVQLLGRGESWRVSRGTIHQQQSLHESSRSRRRGPGNPLSRELALDLAHQLLAIDQTDMRVRLLIPSLLLEGEYHQEAYDFLKHWLKAERSLMLMDLALMGEPMMGGGGNENEEEGALPVPGDYSSMDFSRGGDIVESPSTWMDGEMVYPSIGMVFELAFLKCHLLCSLKSGQFKTEDASHDGSTVAAFGTKENSGSEPITLAKKCVAAGEEELERQVRQLLSVVHKWNPQLLSHLGVSYNPASGASSEQASGVEEGVSVGPIAIATPPALSTLLNKHPPGFELQYKMGNPGGQTLDEAVSIWQRDMILWHVVDPMAMEFLAEFCSSLEENLVDTSCLNGDVECKSDGGLGNGSNKAGTQNQDGTENVLKRKEAEELVAKLQQEKPDRTMGEIMMHPEMAQLMVKHLHTE